MVTSFNSTRQLVYVTKNQTVCREASFTDVGKFLIFNYLIHAFTVISYPGESASKNTAIGLLALLVPGIGLKRAAEAIYQAPMLLRDGPREKGTRFQRLWRWLKEKTGNHVPGNFDYSEPLAMAHAAGALCTIVSISEISRYKLDERDTIRAGSQIYIHGRYKLEEGEVIIRVPRHIPVRSLGVRGSSPSGNGTVLELANNTSILKSLVAICQVLYSAWELYSARGEQLNRYGYAAYSITTIPYALMSLVNLWATILSPQYSYLFLVNRETMEENEEETRLESGEIDDEPTIRTSEINSRMSGVVGILDLDYYDWPSKEPRFNIKQRPNRYLQNAISMYFGIAAFLAAPYVIIYFLTHFSRGLHSTHSQRVWIIMWIVTGQIAAVPFLERLMPAYTLEHAERWKPVFEVLTMCATAPSLVSAIGGYVVVVQMIINFGVCANI